MTYDQYWLDEPECFVAYAACYNESQKDEIITQDTNAWLIGSYTREALGEELAAIYGKKGAPKPKYPKSPVFVDEIDEQAKARKQERLVKEAFNNFVMAAHQAGKTPQE